jgi:hypothetical protein
MEAAVLLCDRDVVDRGLAAAHQAVLVELPLFVAVGAKPVAGGVVPFVLEADRDAVLVECPEILDQAILLLLFPFTGQEGHDRLAALKNLRAVAPAAVLGIGAGNPNGGARIPGVLRHARFLRGGLAGEGWQRRA